MLICADAGCDVCDQCTNIYEMMSIDVNNILEIFRLFKFVNKIVILAVSESCTAQLLQDIWLDSWPYFQSFMKQRTFGMCFVYVFVGILRDMHLNLVRSEVLGFSY